MVNIPELNELITFPDRTDIPETSILLFVVKFGYLTINVIFPVLTEFEISCNP